MINPQYRGLGVDPEESWEDDPFRTADEAQVMNRGRLVKVRFPDTDPPNVQWFWMALGNCNWCQFYVPPATGPAEWACRNPAIGTEAMRDKWQFTNTCPGFKAGISPEAVWFPDSYENRARDVMRAIGIADGEPSQQVEILQDVPWSRWASHQAHYQQEWFQASARGADSGNWDRSYLDDRGPIDTTDRPTVA